ncbi:hypothetical protein AWB85_24165 [Mycobacteroides immunogenum]|uniref:Uncharacterized protein n=2 Tax=Mycobacteroides immunogenum TaxID=83262 RepID=A0A179VEG3_9MYCO|nr:hypothetical protein AWB85_24165 [Mycobacteroides immunogenum]
MAARAEEAFRPKYIVMMGVAGGVKDVAIGDVVASSKVYWIEGGKTDAKFKPRPGFAPISGELLQLARAVAADGTWLARGKAPAGPWPAAGRQPRAFVAPIVVGEKVIADRAADAALLVSESYSDAVAIDMEDFGALRGGAATERSKVIAVRGVSDLLSAKSSADAGGSQEIAAANAAAFLFDLLDRTPSIETHAEVGLTGSRSERALSAGRDLYPSGPHQDGLWERAGGDPSRLNYDGSGASRWWNAIRLIEKGGGGDITIESLVAQMQLDYPGNATLSRWD